MARPDGRLRAVVAAIPSAPAGENRDRPGMLHASPRLRGYGALPRSRAGPPAWARSHPAAQIRGVRAAVRASSARTRKARGSRRETGCRHEPARNTRGYSGRSPPPHARKARVLAGYLSTPYNRAGQTGHGFWRSWHGWRGPPLPRRRRPTAAPPRGRPRIARGAHDPSDFTERGTIQISLLFQYLEHDGE